MTISPSGGPYASDAVKNSSVGLNSSPPELGPYVARLLDDILLEAWNAGMPDWEPEDAAADEDWWYDDGHDDDEWGGPAEIAGDDDGFDEDGDGDDEC